MTNRINEIAALIRELDGDNQLHPYVLGEVLSWRLVPCFDGLNALDVIKFVERTNPDKTTSPVALAELIVAEFDLDKAVR